MVILMRMGDLCSWEDVDIDDAGEDDLGERMKEEERDDDTCSSVVSCQ